jgi:hypothetical protein
MGKEEPSAVSAHDEPIIGPQCLGQLKSKVERGLAYAAILKVSMDFTTGVDETRRDRLFDCKRIETRQACRCVLDSCHSTTASSWAKTVSQQGLRICDTRRVA